MGLFSKRAVNPVDQKAAEAFKRGDTVLMRRIYLHPVRAEERLAEYVMRVQAAGWTLTQQQHSGEGVKRQCSMTFEPVRIERPQ